MAEQLVIKVGADLGDALKALDQLNAHIAGIKKPAADATNALGNLSRIAQDAPFGFIGISNNINPMLESFQRLRKESGGTGAALKAMASGLTGAGGLGLAVGVVSSLLVVFGDKIFSSGKAAKEATQKLFDYKAAVDNAFSSVAQEAAKVEVLVAQLNKENLSRAEKISIVRQLQEISPAYFSTLDKEKATVEQITKAYERYSASIQSSAQVRVLEKQLDNIIDKRLKLSELVNDDPIGRNARQFVIDDKGNRVQKIILETYETEKARTENKTEYLRLLEQERTLVDKIAKTKPVDVTVGDLKLPKVKIKKEKVQKDYTDLLLKIFREMQLPDLKIALIPAIKPDDTKHWIDIFMRSVKQDFEAKTADAGINLSDLFKGEIDFKEFIKNGGKVATYLQDLREKIKINLRDMGEEFGQNITVSIAEGIGNAISGADFKSAFSGVFTVIGSFVQEVGKQMILASTAMAALKKALAGLFANPIAGIAVGVGMVALGAIIKNSFTKIKAFAQGGGVFGPTLALIGEGRGTNRSNPEVVAPLDKLKDLLGGAGGGAFPEYLPMHSISGDTLQLWYQRSQRSQNRRF